SGDAVYLQTYKTRSVNRINNMGYGDIVHPCACFITNSLDAYTVKLIRFVSRFCRLIQVQGIEPSTTSLVVNTASPCAFGGINLYLSAIYLTFTIICIWIVMATCLNTGIRSISL